MPKNFSSSGAPMPTADLRDQLNQLRKKKGISSSPDTANHEFTTNIPAISLPSRAASKPPKETPKDASPATITPSPVDSSLTDLSRKDLLSIIANMAKSHFTPGNAGSTTNTTTPASSNRRKRRRSSGSTTRNERRARTTKQAAQALATDKITGPGASSKPSACAIQALSAPQTFRSEVEAAHDFLSSTPSAKEESITSQPFPADDTTETLLGDSLNSSVDEKSDEESTSYAPPNNASTAPPPTPSHPLPHPRVHKRLGSAYTMTPHMRDALAQRNIPLQRALDIAHGDFSAAEAIRPQLERLARSTMVLPGVTLLELVHIAGTQKTESHAKRHAPSSHQPTIPRPHTTATSPHHPPTPTPAPRLPPALPATATLPHIPLQSPDRQHPCKAPAKLLEPACTILAPSGTASCHESPPLMLHSPSMSEKDLHPSPSSPQSDQDDDPDPSHHTTPIETDNVIPAFTPSPPAQNRRKSPLQIDTTRHRVSLTWTTPIPIAPAKPAQ